MSKQKKKPNVSSKTKTKNNFSNISDITRTTTPVTSNTTNSKLQKQIDNNDSKRNHRLFTLMVIVVSICWQVISSSSSSWGKVFSKLHFQNFQNTQRTPISDSDKIENFIRWLKDNGAIISPSVTIASFPNFGGFGLQAKLQHRLEENEDDNHKIAIHHLDEMFTIPESIIISSKSVYQQFQASIPNFQSKLMYLIHQFIHYNSQLIHQDIVIALYLMVQCTLKDDSLFYPYLDILPSYIIPRLDTFNDEELDMLQDEDLKDLAKNSYHELHSLWKSEKFYSFLSLMINNVAKQNDNIKSNHVDIGYCISFQSFHKYVAIVSSRAMVLQGTKYLTPLAEFANYHPRKDDRKLMKGRMGQSFTLYHEHNDNGSISVRADRDILYGEQIFEDYGDIDNSLYLEAHGFVPNENPFHCAMVSSKLIPSPKDIPIILRKALVALKILPEKDSELIPPPSVCILDDGSILDNGVEAYLTVIAMVRDGNQGTMEQCSEALDTGDEELVKLQCLHYDGHKQILYELIQSLSTQSLCKSSTTLKEDFNLLNSLMEDNQPSDSLGEDPTKKILALKFRMADKMIFHNIGAVNDDFDCSQIDDIEKNHPSVNGVSNPIINKPPESKTETETSILLEKFNKFIDSLDMPVRKVEAKFVGGDMRIGVVATEEIEEGDVYLSIHSSSVIDLDTATIETNGQMNKVLDLLTLSQQDGGFEVLLFFLLHEKFISQQRSTWHAYLELLPTVHEVRHSSPLFFDDILYDYAAGSNLRTMLRNNKRKADDLFTHMSMNKDILKLLGPAMQRENFLWAYGVVDSRYVNCDFRSKLCCLNLILNLIHMILIDVYQQRSIWWDGKRHLVPLLDFVNCMEQHNQSGDVTAAHKTFFDDSNHAITKASRAYKMGEQIFENYGQPNHIYFTYHGFMLDNNSHDCAYLNGIGIDSKDKSAQNMTEIRMKLSNNGFTSLNPSFCIRDDSSLDKLAQFLKIKYGESDSVGMTPAVLPYARKYLQHRFRRYSQGRRVVNFNDATIPEPVKSMVKIVNNEMQYVELALNSLMSK